ncbi:MAG: ATP-dependent helicase [Christensenellales bacterium]
MYNNSIILNDEQCKAAYDTEGAVLVIAGAGSGKTRVLTARIAHLIEMGVPQSAILAITFTNKAANEMKERLSAVMGGNCYVTSGTFHSFCAKVLRVDGDNLGYTSSYTIYTETECDRLVKRILTAMEEDVKLKGKILWHISNAKSKNLSPEEYLDSIKFDVVDAELIHAVFVEYEKQMKNNNAMDFDDLLIKTNELFENFPGVLQKYAERYRYINVDEFQDTNAVQLELVKKLASVHGNVFVVGDEDQSIYSWRGAEIKNILEFEKSFNGAKIYKLEQNYRSSMPILTCANNVIKNNHKRQKKTLWSDIAHGEEIKYYDAPRDIDEAVFVARTINSLICDEGENYRDIAVLVRANSLTRIFEENFKLHGIPYKVFGGFKFFERKEIKDFISYLRMACNPSDEDAILRNINNPKRGIGDTTVDRLVAWARGKGVSVMSALGMIDECDSFSSSVKNKIKSFGELAVNLIMNAKIMSPSKFAEYVLQASGFESALTQGDLDDKNRLENMEELVAAIAQFEKDNQGATISEYLEQVSLISDSDEMTDDNYVTVATIHAVKGLEFDNVFIVGLEETVFPSSRATTSGDIEEERRLMYVAITRAKKRLYASWAKVRNRFGQFSYNPVSRFVEEMTDSKVYSKPHNATVERPQVGVTASVDSFRSTFNASQKIACMNKNNGDFAKFKQNCIVEHTKFGRGVITAVEGNGDDVVLSILFKGLGIKRFALSIAINSLSLVEE